MQNLSLPTAFQRIATVLEMIKFQHSVFALPFALAAMLTAARGIPRPGVFILIVLACVFARSAAMAFNRWTDVTFDRANPRTRDRALVTGRLSPEFALMFMLACAGAFILCAAMLNRLCFFLSPLALAVVLGYSYVKRWSYWTHFVLGAALGLAPVGAWLAVRGTLEGAATAMILGLAVMMWTAGFDIIYACQDFEFDRRAGLHSLPAAMGIAGALRVSSAAHVISFLGLLGFWMAAGLGTGTLLAILAIGVVLAVEHWMTPPHDLSRVPAAFFTMNGLVSFLFLLGSGFDILMTGIAKA
ncbi:MAG: putative 4-hydroxybenzoate polyprenyltransferase [Candidatus Sumerlaeota bacterium]|nr:putative 4-hydroxybenzoate polyprenyltransferase [Candidatus Sumerlaeota bacterium]